MKNGLSPRARASTPRPCPLRPSWSSPRQSQVQLQPGRDGLELKLHEVTSADSSQGHPVQVQVQQGAGEPNQMGVKQRKILLWLFWGKTAKKSLFARFVSIQRQTLTKGDNSPLRPIYLNKTKPEPPSGSKEGDEVGRCQEVFRWPSLHSLITLERFSLHHWCTRERTVAAEAHRSPPAELGYGCRCNTSDVCLLGCPPPNFDEVQQQGTAVIIWLICDKLLATKELCEGTLTFWAWIWP